MTLVEVLEFNRSTSAADRLRCLEVHDYFLEYYIVNLFVMSTTRAELLKCNEYVKELTRWPNVKKTPAEAEWRLNLSAVIKKCRDADAEEVRTTGVPTTNPIPYDCDPDQITGLASIFENLMEINSIKHGLDNSEESSDGRPVKKKWRSEGGKMVGGALYDKLVAQLDALGGWLTYHAGRISDCAKWFLQKIWSAATLVAQAIVQATNAAKQIATNAATTSAVVAAAGAEVTGITDMFELLGILTEFGEAAINDIHNTILMEPNTVTGGAAKRVFNVAIEALRRLIVRPTMTIGTPYVDAITQYINDVMTANKAAVVRTMSGIVADPKEFQNWLRDTPVTKKLYCMLVSLKLVQTISFTAGLGLTVLTATGRATIFLAPIVYNITNSNIFTTALLLHAGFYQLSVATQDRLISAYNAADRAFANTVLPEPDEHKVFTTRLYEVLQQADLDNYTEFVRDRQKIAEISTQIGEVRKRRGDVETRIVAKEKITATRMELDTEQDQLDDKQRLLNDMIISEGIVSSIRTTFSKAAGGGGGAGGQPSILDLASELARAKVNPVQLADLADRAATMAGAGAGAGAGARSDAANGSLPRSGAGAMDEEIYGGGAGGKRSTRKRGMNKKGGAKSKRSPKSTQKAGRKQSARKRR